MRKTPPGPRRWFSRRLHRFLWRKLMAPLLMELECGWLDGACATCAEGLLRYITFSRTLEPAAVSLAIIADARCPAHHILVKILYHGMAWYVDANGVSSERELLRYWRDEEHLVDPFLAPHDDALLEAMGMRSVPRISTKLAQLFFDHFGPFSPAWLDEDDESALSPGARPGAFPPLPGQLRPAGGKVKKEEVGGMISERLNF